MHLAWDVMVGLGTLLFLLSALVRAVVAVPARHAEEQVFLWIAACAGVLVGDHAGGGWVVTEVGRQPWIVYNYMKVEDAATGNTGVWITFIVVVVLYIGLGVTTDPRAARDEPAVPRGRRAATATTDVPYGPRGPAARTPDAGARSVAMSDRGRGRPVLRRHRVRACSAAPTSAPGSGTSSPAAPSAGERPRAVIDHSIGPVWEANHVWLIFCLVVLWTAFSEAFASITLTLFVPLTLAALGIVLRGSSFAFRKAVFAHSRPAQLRRRVRVVVGARAVLHGRGRRRDRVGPGPGRRQGRRPVGQLGQPDLDPRRRARGRACARTSPRSTWCGTPAGSATPTMVEYFRRRAVGRGGRGRRRRVRRDLRAARRRRYVFDGLTSRALPLVIISAVCGVGSLVLLLRRTQPLARACSRCGAVASDRASGGASAQWPYILPTSLTVAEAAAPSGTLAAVLVATALAVVLLGPSFGLLYSLDQRSLLPEEGATDQASAGS